MTEYRIEWTNGGCGLWHKAMFKESLLDMIEINNRPFVRDGLPPRYWLGELADSSEPALDELEYGIDADWLAVTAARA